LEIALLHFVQTLVILLGVFLIFRFVDFNIKIVDSDFNTPVNLEGEKFDIERKLKDRQFDERIQRLKDEVALEQLIKPINASKPAQELHPMVHNLPHDEIYSTYDKEEYSI